MSVLYTASGEFRANLYSCSIDDQCCKFLMRGMSRCPTPNATGTAQLSLDLWENRIHQDGIRYIAQVLKNRNILRRINLYDFHSNNSVVIRD